jgi:hypothetical protein
MLHQLEEAIASLGKGAQFLQQVDVNKLHTQKSGFLKKSDFSALKLLGSIVPICLCLPSA